jgi:hypothetical protein
LEEELKAYKVAQLKIKLAEWGLIQTGRTPELIKRLLNPQPSDLKSKQKIEPWKYSKDKELLIRMLRGKTSTFHHLIQEKAWDSLEWFEIYLNNMKSIKRSLEASELIVANDNILIEAEISSLRMLHRATVREYPLWHDNDASQLLKKDLEDGLKKK